MRHHALRWAWLVLGLVLVAPAVHGQEREPVRIGIIYTNSGPLAQLGIDMRDGNLLYWNIVVAFNWSAALDTPENRRFREAFESRYKRPVSLTAESGYVGAQMIAKALEGVKGEVENLDALLTALKRIDVDAPRERSGSTKRRSAAEYADRELFEHEPVLDVDSGRVHGHALLPRAERQVGEVKLAGR